MTKIDEFLDYLTTQLGEGQLHPPWVFRGMADASWDLLPSAHRDLDNRSALFAEFYDQAKAVLDCNFHRMGEGLNESHRQIMDSAKKLAYEAFLVNRAERDCVHW